MSAKHSPGPWHESGIAIEDGDGYTVCIMGEIDGFESGYDPCENSTANARLIAAAPELLAELKDKLRMLEAAYRDLGMSISDNPRIERARAVIAKAEWSQS